ncbi:bifunctional hydroxymethylpyrimidine kinase/phosphomethylpyrimidine kinase [Hymenobacter sp. NST-14]|uniref:bifunctional hydroxymethylpyrimidine kinase/phosphomethylpyrimidine kinase n=1 Tax=Hymenobacter piscis TaxID=2839984 RepID=UPI001C016286|nr:bifunctional hydroxymethylpyrimidine kinase/phosphomethylpyrimidine kinase [Hymenobacter piscis]MBT9394843.1 bifunctional hydroxymethylpyrimidine kinase/phosphomethylpyrimidine kinase [Hymenobacter piscis]
MPTTFEYPSVLTIAGFDGSGGAGIQGDMKAISALGCYATSVLTALPVQNTCGVRSIFPIPAAAVAEQLAAIFDDVVPHAIKIGMVHTPELVHTIATALRAGPAVPVIFDPVMVATSGHRLIEQTTLEALTGQLFPLSELITPNLDEAAILADMPIPDVTAMHEAGRRIRARGCRGLLLKGGHLPTPTLVSLYFADDGSVHEFTTPKLATTNTHGSGCTLSSAIASYRALGYPLLEAVGLGQQYVHEAIRHGQAVRTGQGNGPLNHFFAPLPLLARELVN